ncbi:hypothetical protein [Nitrosomonas sp.]|uniref:hypothetical protein n=1 Tax=Nitrosomonas sp. TaxID=42353 RepID=UPI002842226A|nr:hypothetical protein [Nitrosomonas sp.]MDR4514899.1 hypothetical protein [Nitrosomonas sp.]
MQKRNGGQDDDATHVQNAEQSDIYKTDKTFVMCEDGEIIKHAILDLLSAYEYLAAGKSVYS